MDLIDLQASNVTQLSNNGVKGDWTVKKNITGEPLHVFPSVISDKLMFEVLNFAKKYELIAFNEGIKFQKTKQNAFLLAQVKELEAVNNEIAAENIRLATILENLLPE
jgi:hypothetical protein